MKTEHPQQLRYQGYRSTPPLWSGRAISPVAQIDLPVGGLPLDPAARFKHQRLGKLVEEFVCYELGLQSAVAWIANGLQIREDKRTVGELDALYFDRGTPVHLEVAYKFYLYDTLRKHPTSLASWIGPNRKDNLSLKLRKLHDKQFPLLHSLLTEPYLRSYGLAAADIVQRLCFKGQLFLPYENQGMATGPLNQSCVAGFHLSFRELETLNKCSFYLPGKPDWLITPHAKVDWLEYPVAATHIGMEVGQNRSPLVWLMYPDGSLGKCFVTFW
jgi:hypothetical protein